MREYHRGMVRRTWLRSMARVALVAVVYAQAAIAFAACESMMPSAAQAIVQAGMTCHEPEQNTNLCVSHCLASDQSLDKPSLFVPMFALPSLPIFVSFSHPVARLSASHMRAPVTGPPIRILFRTLLI